MIGQLLPYLGEFVHIQCSFSVSTAHLDISELAFITELLPGCPDETLALFSIEIRMIFFSLRNHLLSEKPIG